MFFNTNSAILTSLPVGTLCVLFVLYIYIFIWEHGEEKLRTFVETLNEIHPTIKFTAKWSQNQLIFWMLQFL